jgi:hypothetical protein
VRLATPDSRRLTATNTFDRSCSELRCLRVSLKFIDSFRSDHEERKMKSLKKHHGTVVARTTLSRHLRRVKGHAIPTMVPFSPCMQRNSGNWRKLSGAPENRRRKTQTTSNRLEPRARRPSTRRSRVGTPSSGLERHVHSIIIGTQFLGFHLTAKYYPKQRGETTD